MALADIRTRVDEISKVPTAVVSQTDSGTRDRCIADALKRYNKDRPRVQTLVLAAVGGDTWEYSLSTNISGWNPSQYTIRKLVYPGGRQSANELDENNWDIRRKADGTYWLRFVRNNPAGGWDIWIHYTGPHTLTSTTDTVTADSPNDVDAFCHLAAALVLEIAANNYADKGATTLGADTVDYKNKAAEAAARAKAERAIYEQHIGSTRAQSVFVDWDTVSQDGQEYLFWPRGAS